MLRLPSPFASLRADRGEEQSRRVRGKVIPIMHFAGKRGRSVTRVLIVRVCKKLSHKQ